MKRAEGTVGVETGASLVVSMRWGGNLKIIWG